MSSTAGGGAEMGTQVWEAVPWPPPPGEMLAGPQAWKLL